MVFIRHLLIFFGCAFSASFAFSAVCTPTSWSASMGDAGGTGSSASAACAAAGAAYEAKHPGSNSYATLGGGSGGSYLCYLNDQPPGYTSPRLYVMSGTASGDGTCTAPPANGDAARCSDASAINNSTLGITYEEVTIAGSVSSGTSICAPTSGTSSPSVGCSVNFTLDIGYAKPDGSMVSRGTIDTQGGYVSLPCSTTTTDPTKPKPAEIATCPAGQQMGQINGGDSCQPYEKGTTSKTTESTGSKTGAGVEETSKTETSCSGTTCTSTTTTTNSTNSTTSTSTSTVSKPEFCSSSPASKQCEGENSSGGGGGEESGGCEEGADTIGCAKFGQPGAQGETQNTNVALTFSREAGFGASDGTCPAPRVLNIPGGRTISMSFDMYCDFARGNRPFIIGFALLSAAGMVVFGATRKG